MIVATAALCLALNLYHEARGEPIMGQYAVAMVTLNRARGDAERVCTEVFKHKQFSWANTQAVKVSGGWQISQRMVPTDEFAWWKARRIAEVALAGRMPDFTQGATHYHATWVKPYWTQKATPLKVVGKHKFYVIAKSVKPD